MSNNRWKKVKNERKTSPRMDFVPDGWEFLDD